MMGVIMRQIKAIGAKFKKMVGSSLEVFVTEINWVLNDTVLVSTGHCVVVKNISF